MSVNFCMYGPYFDAYDFLLKANYLPEQYDLWEDIEVMKDQGPGFTLQFKSNEQLIPFSFGKFVIANRHLLSDKSFTKGKIEKELSVKLKPEVLLGMQNPNSIFILQPIFMKLLGELNIKLYLGRA
jgi:hypothetical protein